jgi:hypothetical protein
MDYYIEYVRSVPRVRCARLKLRGICDAVADAISFDWEALRPAREAGTSASLLTVAW